MSRIPIGRYKDGSVKYCYFRRSKHSRIKRNGFGRIRHRMMIASWIKENADIDRYIERQKNK